MPAVAHPEGVSANISASACNCWPGSLEWRLQLQEELSEGILNQLQQVFTQTREVSHFLLTGEQQESVTFPFSSSDNKRI